MNNLKKLRLKFNLTLRELEEKTLINHGNLSSMENGKRYITTENAKILADFFDVSIDYLLGYEKKKQERQTVIYSNAKGEKIEIDLSILIPNKILVDKEDDSLKITDLNNPTKIDVFKLEK